MVDLAYPLDRRLFFARCAKMPHESKEFLVTGLSDTDNLYFCSTARGSLQECGIEGKQFEEKGGDEII